MKWIVFILALLPSLVFAASATINWSNATQNVDGTPIPATGPGSLTATRIEYGTCSGTSFGTVQGQVTVPAPGTSTVIDGLTSGVNYCFRGFHTNTFGEVSAASNVVARTMPNPVPRPPVLSSTVTVAWEQRRFFWFNYLAQVGSIPLGTECGDKSIQVKGTTLNEVDAKYITGKVNSTKTYYTICA